jgi:hypothetical protein
MLDARLIRIETSDEGTFGHFVAGRLVLFSGELPRRNNASNVSCIPTGTYRCVLTYSQRFGRPLYLVDGVADRVGIRVHPANFMGKKPPYLCQLNGCIALGEKLGWIDGQKAILISAPAVRRLEDWFQGKSFTLEIRDA